MATYGRTNQKKKQQRPSQCTTAPTIHICVLRIGVCAVSDWPACMHSYSDGRTGEWVMMPVNECAKIFRMCIGSGDAICGIQLEFPLIHNPRCSGSFALRRSNRTSVLLCLGPSTPTETFVQMFVMFSQFLEI